jgi:hypothetical protein
MGEVMDQFMFGLTENLGAGRDGNDDIFAVFAVALVAFPVAPPLCLKEAFVLKMKEGIDPIGALNIDVSPFSAIAAAGTASWLTLLPSESKAAIAAASGNHLDFGAVNKQFGSSVDFFENRIQESGDRSQSKNSK